MIFFIDMMSVRGHLNLNNFYLQRLTSCKPVLYISEDLKEKFPEVFTCSIGKMPCRSGILDRFMTALRVISILARQRPYQVVFLSYDLLTFPVISYVADILGTKVLCFEHNTAPRTRSKQFLHRIMSSRVKCLVYATHILPLYEKAAINATYVPHPCVRLEQESGGESEWSEIIEANGHRFDKVAFCPSASVSLELITQVADQYSDTLFVCKSTRSSTRSNIECRSYFESYGEALRDCDFVCVLFPFDHKVSGPAFESIAMGRPVMVLKNAFGKYMKSLFPDAVFFPGESVPSEFVTSVNQYNKLIICKISEYIT